MNTENPPKVEGEKTFIVVESKGQGFTIVDENKDDYLWKDGDGQVLWTKDVNEAHAKRKELQQKELAERTIPEKNTMTQEAMQKLKDEKEALLLENQTQKEIITTKKTAKQKELEALENTEKMVSPTSATPDAEPKPTEPSDEEKLKIIREQVLAEVKRKTNSKKETKEIDRRTIFNQAKQEQEQEIASAREKYMDRYDEGVKEGHLVYKYADKVINWLGLGKKDANMEQNYGVKIKRDLYNTEKDQKGDKTRELFIEKRLEDKVRELQNENWSTEKIDTFKRRYAHAVKGATGDTANTAEKEILKGFENNDLQFAQNENTALREAKQKVWEANKDTVEKMLASVQEWTKRNLEDKPRLKQAVGSKWFKKSVGFAATSSLYAGLGGGFSALFFAHRALGYTGGLVGGRLGKLLADTVLSEKKLKGILDKKMVQLENDYQAKKIQTSGYDERREAIDRLMQRYNVLAKGGMAVGGALLGGLAGGSLDKETGLSDQVSAKWHEAKDWMSENAQMPWKAGDLASGNFDTTDPAHTNTGPADTDQASDKIPKTGEATLGTKSTDITPDEHTIIAPGSGLGPEHAFRAEIEHDTVLAEKLKTILHYDGDITTQKGLHEFSGIVAHKIALAEGYATVDGSERWVFGDKPVAFEIEIEGKEILIHEKVLTGDKWIEMDSEDRVQGHFEKDLDKVDGNVYEKTHTVGGENTHPSTPTDTHIKHLRESIKREFEPLNTDDEYIEPTLLDDNTGAGSTHTPREFSESVESTDDDVIEPTLLETESAASTGEYIQPTELEQEELTTEEETNDIEAKRNNSRFAQTQVDPGTPSYASKDVYIYRGPSVKNGPPTRGNSFFDILAQIFLGGR